MTDVRGRNLGPLGAPGRVDALASAGALASVGALAGVGAPGRVGTRGILGAVLLCAWTAVAGVGCGSAQGAATAGGTAGTVATAGSTAASGPVGPAAGDAGGASAAAADGGAPSSPASKQDRLIARMLRRVEAARGLRASRPVPGVRLDPAALIASVKEHVAREEPPEALRDVGIELGLFGFVPTDIDYEAAEFGLMKDQLAGYYEPSDGTMYLRADLEDDASNEVLAHELTHALQDQRWNLGDRSKYRPGDSDRLTAVSLLAEGDAQSAMLDVMLAMATKAAGAPLITALDRPDEAYTEAMRAEMEAGPGAGAPHIMRTSLVAPYIHGMVFVHALRRQGGWAAVDQAWDDRPTTSEQVLHVEKWRAHEAPLAVPAPTFASLPGTWTVLDEDSEGELGVRLAFEEWLGAKAAAELSAGWGGDRGVLLRSGDLVAHAWRLRYDPGKTPDERTRKAWAALTRALDAKLGGPKGGGPSMRCYPRADRGSLAVARAGSGGTDLVFVLGPTRVTGGTWSSAGDCALSAAWLKEIAGPLAR